VEQGYDEKFGARPLKRAIQKYLEDPFAEEIINAHIEEGDLLMATYVKDDTKLSIEVIKGGFLKLPSGAKEALESDVQVAPDKSVDIEDAQTDETEA
jgi:hypothetical protein